MFEKLVVPKVSLEGEILSILIEKGHTSPLPDAFKTDTELILFEKFGLDKKNNVIVKVIQEKARVFQSAVKTYYKRYCKLDTIIEKNKVRSLLCSYFQLHYT